MNIKVSQKNVHELLPTDILFQTAYWGDVKSHLGCKPLAFDFRSSTGQSGDLLILIRGLDPEHSFAYVPQGPEFGPDPERHGPFLETMSQALGKQIGSNVVFIRYDLPWESPYAAEASDGQPWPGYPPSHLRELRMNIGTRTWNLRKSELDLTVADTLVIDLARPEADILSAMKPKARYNIRLAQRKGVRVIAASPEMLPVFYDLYRQTARRNRFPPGDYGHFSALFSASSGSSEILFLLAAKGDDILAGAIIAISGKTAVYLFGASSNQHRNLMGSYAVQWDGIVSARAKGCISYDMGSVSPVADPGHPFYGMYRFKTGFGGRVIHRGGSWDYPFDMQKYNQFRNYELLSAIALDRGFC